MLNINNLIGFGAGLKGPISVEYITVTGDASNLTTYTFSSVALGSPTVDDLVVVCIGADNEASGNRTVVSGSVAGISCNMVLSTNSNQPAAIMTASGVTVASGDVTVTLSDSVQRCNIGIYVIRNPTSYVAVSSDSEADNSSSDDTVINIPANGVAISVGYSRTTSGNSYTWAISSGSITENYDQTGAESSGRFSVAVTNIQNTQRSGATITATHVSASSSLVSASWS